MSSQSFSEIERQAQVAEKLREQQAADAKKQAEESMCVSAREAPAYVGLGGRDRSGCLLNSGTLVPSKGCLHASGLPGAPD